MTLFEVAILRTFDHVTTCVYFGHVVAKNVDSAKINAISEAHRIKVPGFGAGVPTGDCEVLCRPFCRSRQRTIFGSNE